MKKEMITTEFISKLIEYKLKKDGYVVSIISHFGLSSFSDIKGGVGIIYRIYPYKNKTTQFNSNELGQMYISKNEILSFKNGILAFERVSKISQLLC